MLMIEQEWRVEEKFGRNLDCKINNQKKLIPVQELDVDEPQLEVIRGHGSNESV